MGFMDEPRFQLEDNGMVSITLPLDEFEVLYNLVSGLIATLSGTNPLEPLDPMVDRLFPAVFEDPLEALAYDRHNAEFIALRHLKINRLGRVKEELSRFDKLVGQLWRTEVTLEELEIWMYVFQDLRLSTSRIARIEKEEDVEHLDEEMKALLHWLAFMLDDLVHIFLETD